MHILSQKSIQDNRCAVFQVGSKVWKLPLTAGGWREVSLEKNMILEARQDPHFSRFLPSYGFVWLGLNLPFVRPLESHDDPGAAMMDYFSAAFERNNNWPVVALGTLPIVGIFLDFLTSISRKDMDLWKNLVQKISVRQSSAHGDFHAGHVFFQIKRLWFIDWTQYSLQASRYFDLINFWIFSQKRGSESWMEVWKRNFEEPPREMFDVAISRSDFTAYAIWKIAVELKLLGLRRRVDERKRKKYQSFIESLESVLRLETFGV